MKRDSGTRILLTSLIFAARPGIQGWNRGIKGEIHTNFSFLAANKTIFKSINPCLHR